MDFMNLNQSAHGDREFGYLATRLRRRARSSSATGRDAEVQRRIGIWTRAARGWHEAQHLRIARFGDNMRDVAVTEGDKVEVQIRLGISVNGYGVSELAATCSRSTTRLSTHSSRNTTATTSSPPNCARADRHSRCGMPHGSSSACGSSSTASGRWLHGHVRGPRPPAATARHRGAAPHGRRVRLRGRGRLEDAGPRPAGEGDGVGLTAGRRSWRTTRTTSAPNIRRARRAMLEVCPSIASGRPSCEIHPLAIGGHADPVRLVFTAPPGPGFVLGSPTSATASAWSPTRSTWSRPTRTCRGCPVAPCRLGAPGPNLSIAAEFLADCWRTAPHVLHPGAPVRGLSRISRRSPASSWSAIGSDTTAASLRRELRWNEAYHHLAGGL